MGFDSFRLNVKILINHKPQPILKHLKFNISHLGNTYNVYIERGVNHEFRRKHDARKFIEKYKSVINDNVLIMGNINEQLNVLYRLYYPFIPSRISREFAISNDDFNDCYNRIYDPVKTYVQFNAIRASFNYVESRILLLKRFAQRYKHKVLLAQLYPLAKMFDLIYTSYNEDIGGLTDGVSYRTELRTIPKTDNIKENEPKPNYSRRLP